MGSSDCANCGGQYGNTPLDLAERGGHEDVAALLRQYGARADQAGQHLFASVHVDGDAIARLLPGKPFTDCGLGRT